MGIYTLNIQGIDVDTAVNSIKKQLKNDETISSTMRASIELLLVLISVLVNTVTLNSANSSKPPSSDPNRKKKSKAGASGRKPGGQKGHHGSTLKKVDDPDEVVELKIAPDTLPESRQFHEAGIEARQVIDIEINQIITEYRAQVLKDEQGNRFVAEFPAGVTRPVQYGSNVKANAVYMSHYQMIPYERITDHFKDQLGLSISSGTLFNFNKQAYELLASFEDWAKRKLISSEVIHADETGINIGSKNHWLHCASTSWVTLFFPHEKRGKEAMDDMGVLPMFKGILCHDHWKPYFRYSCDHALCNAHHLRELERAHEQDQQQWALQMKQFLQEANIAVIEAGGKLDDVAIKQWEQRYRKIIDDGNVECPPPENKRRNGKPGRIKRSKSRNLLERLRDFESEVLRFMRSSVTPFTNNQGENDIRMTKVHQKVSGCFRSFEGAQFFCRIRSFITTAKKHGVSPTTALRLLFQGKMPDFMVDSS